MITAVIKDVELELDTHAALFSPQRVDAGTLAMLDTVEFMECDKVLDLGCGYGVVGILAARLIGERNVVMCDVDETAVAVSRCNAERNGVGGIKIVQSDGFRALDDTGFSLILCNPPYHADFAVAKYFIEKGFNRLALGGRMVMVTKRRDWYKNKLISIFGGVRIAEADGYHIFTAEKRSMSYR